MPVTTTAAIWRKGFFAFFCGVGSAIRPIYGEADTGSTELEYSELIIF
jgi:hypothetical protein